MTATPAEVKACCASACAARGGALAARRPVPSGRRRVRLTSRLARALGVAPGAVVVDVACGPGASTIQVARETGCAVVGVDLAADSVRAARDAAAAAGLSERARFVEGDAEALRPTEDASVARRDLRVRALHLPRQAHRRVRDRHGGPEAGARLALSDVVAERDRLPDDLRTLDAWVACFADARPLDEVEDLLAGAGLEPELSDGATTRRSRRCWTVSRRACAPRRCGCSGGASLPRWRARRHAWAGAGRRRARTHAVGDGALGYAVVTARRR